MLSHIDWEKVTPANVQETVKFDILGDRKLQFTDEAVWYFTQEILVVPLPPAIVTGMLVRNKPIRYRDIRWVGPVTKKQWGMLALGVPGAAAGLYMVATNLNNGGGALAVAAVILVLLGVIPLWTFGRGRKFLAIASDTEVICFPMDRKRKQVRKAIELVRKYCPGDGVRWQVPLGS